MAQTFDSSYRLKWNIGRNACVLFVLDKTHQAIYALDDVSKLELEGHYITSKPWSRD